MNIWLFSEFRKYEQEQREKEREFQENELRKRLAKKQSEKQRQQLIRDYNKRINRQLSDIELVTKMFGL